jgi:hypothetical protein
MKNDTFMDRHVRIYCAADLIWFHIHEGEIGQHMWRIAYD